MKKNILLGLMLLSVAPVFSADVEAAGVPAVAQRGGICGFIWSCVPAQRYLGNQALYATAGGGAAYTAAHCSGAFQDSWLRWIGLGGLCTGLYIGNRHYRSAEHETGVLTQRATGAEVLAAERQRTIVEQNTALLQAATERGQIVGERNAANARVTAAERRLTTESERHATAEAAASQKIEKLSGTVADGLGEVQRTLGVNQGGLRILLGTQITTIRSQRVNSIAAGVALRGAGRDDDATEADAVVLALDRILPRLRALEGEAQGAGLLALPRADAE